MSGTKAEYRFLSRFLLQEYRMEFPAGWTCERTQRKLEEYLRSTLVLAESLAVAEHVEACPVCAERLVLDRVTVRRVYA